MPVCLYNFQCFIQKMSKRYRHSLNVRTDNCTSRADLEEKAAALGSKAINELVKSNFNFV